MQAGFGVIFDILSGDDGPLMMCLLWINAQRMTGRINDLYNTSQQQLSLILVLFPGVHCNQSSRMEGTRECLVTAHVPLGSTHRYAALSPSFGLSGIVSVAGELAPPGDWVKELRVRPRGCAVTEPLPPASPRKLQSLAVARSLRTQPGGDRGN